VAKLVHYGMPAIEVQAALDALHLEIAPLDPAMAGSSSFGD
jgi:hypothetical protein